MAIREYIVKITDEVEPDGFERFEDEYVPEGELVRCKDCIYKPYCAYQIHAQTIDKENDWFCADGVRRDD